MIYDLIIIGSGPAGLTAAIYAQRARLNTLVIEKNYMSGGQVLNTYEVDNYPGLPGIGGFDLGTKFREHAEGLGAAFARDEVLKIEDAGAVKKVVASGGVYETSSIIIATGAHHKKLGVPGEEEFAGMGVSYCATCDGAFFKDRTVVVVGGGDVAAEDAIFLARMCAKVYVVHRRDELRAAKSLQEKLFFLENVEMVWDSVVTAIEGDGQVTGAQVSNVKTGEKRVLAADGVFIAVGITPDTALFSGFVDMDAAGCITAGEDCATSAPGIFCAGDARTKALRQIVTAVADGAVAVASAQNYLTNS